LNGTTQNNLSFNKVDLDHVALRKTAAIAFGLSHNEIGRLHGSLHGINTYTDSAQIYLNAKRLADLAADFAIVADTLVALNGCATREEVTLINKPELEETKF